MSTFPQGKIQPGPKGMVRVLTDYNDPSHSGLGTYCSEGWQQLKVGDRVLTDCGDGTCEAVVTRIRPIASSFGGHPDALINFSPDFDTWTDVNVEE